MINKSTIVFFLLSGITCTLLLMACRKQLETKSEEQDTLVTVSQDVKANYIEGYNKTISDSASIVINEEIFKDYEKYILNSKIKRKDAALWLKRMEKIVDDPFKIIIGQLADEKSVNNYKKYYRITFQIDTVLSGNLDGKEIQIIQQSLLGEPDPEYGFKPVPGHKYLLIITPSKLDNSLWEISMNFEELLFGWAYIMPNNRLKFNSGPDTLSIQSISKWANEHTK